MTETPDPSNLNICAEHLLPMTARDDSRRRCPACHLDDPDVRPEKEVPGEPSQNAVRLRIPAETVEELYPLMDEYLDGLPDTDGPWIVPYKFEGDLPAGYSEAQERWLTALVYESGALRRAVTLETDARETIENLS